LITQHQFTILIGMYTCLDMIMSVMGVVTNTVNIKTFVAMGADDGVTVAFLFLSSAELVCCLAALGQKIAMAFWVTEMATDYRTWFDVSPYALNVFFGNIRGGLFSIPVFITTYLAVAKCMCVVQPLAFRNMFSVSRTVRVMTGICIFGVVSHIPVMATIGIAETLDKKVNATRRVMWYSPYRDIVKTVIWNAKDTFPSLATQVIIIICVVVMAKELTEAVNNREKLKSGSFYEDPDDGLKKSKTGKRQFSRLTGKELQVIKQVTLISVVYIVANTPKIVIFLAFAFTPEMTQGGTYQNMYDVTIRGKDNSELYMSVANIFIYYKYNSKFKQYCTLKW
ncbi:unnamed protein product, partial [Lymnaea stagnalis]